MSAKFGAGPRTLPVSFGRTGLRRMAGWIKNCRALSNNRKSYARVNRSDPRPIVGDLIVASGSNQTTWNPRSATQATEMFDIAQDSSV